VGEAPVERRARTLALALGLAGVLLAANLVHPGSALADTAIDFEQFAPGTTITNQYANAGGSGQGVVFGPLPGGAPGEGLKPVIRMPPAGQAHSGSQVADIATCPGCEFFSSRTTGTFAAPRSNISMRVGYLGESATCTAANPDAIGCAVVRLRAYDVNGNQVGEASVRVTRGAGVHSLLSVSTPSATIVGFELSGRSGTDDGKQIAMDDLIFGTAPPPTPDFTLNPAATTLVLEQGGSATDQITIGRLGGSTGDIALAASGLPPGVTADFAPNPASGTQTVLTLRADSNADVTTKPVVVTGTPQSASVGPAPRSFTLELTVQRACPQVRTAQELVDKLAAGFKCIFVVGAIDLTQVLEAPVSGPEEILGDPRSIITVPDGVTLMSSRSPTNNGGVLSLSHRVFERNGLDKRNMLRLGSSTRVTGLRLQGYNFSDRKDRKDQTSATAIINSSGVLVDNNEIYGWPNAAVTVSETPDAITETPRITENFLHNNLQCNRGYGVVVSHHGFARIDRNVFSKNRHDVAGHGDPGDGYTAEHNFSLIGGPKCDPGDTFQHYNQHYDMHGEQAKGGTGGVAGTFMSIRNNTIRGAQTYYQIKKRPAFWLRGTPQDKAIFSGNAVHSPSSFGRKGAVRLTGAFAPALLGTKLVIKDNDLCLDTAGQVAVGDFNGDGRDDVFQAVGTAWFYSPSGKREWFFLRGSSLRRNRLGLGDFDGDGKTDVFIQSERRWLVSSGGTGDPEPLPAESNINIQNYRFADFDGDGRTDVFRANGSHFFISSAGTTAWQPLASSRFELGDLRFGDFDGDGKTDVFSFANGQWSVSYGATTRWQRLNRKLSSDLGKLVFADFNGDGKTDVARTTGNKWEFSLGGATAWQTLSNFGRSVPLDIGMLFGDFTGDGSDDVLQHARKDPTLACWAVANGTTRLTSLERYQLSSRESNRRLEPWSIADVR
jgi:hypothetical protein